MKISLISPYPDITNYGLRTLSSVLRREGHELQIFCMPDLIGEGETEHVEQKAARYTPEVLQQLVDKLDGVELVGITLMTHYFASARQLTRAIKAHTNAKVVWGGFHPSQLSFLSP